MTGYIDNYNFAELDCMKYWQPPSSWSKEKSKQEIRNRIGSGEWLGSQKRDGALYVLLKDEDGNITLRGRAKSVKGVYIDKYDHLPHLHEWVDSLPNGTCLLGEVYWRGHEGSNNTTSIMNCLTKKAIERQVKDENKMIYYVFDVLAFDNKSLLNTVADDRFNLLLDLHTKYPNKYVEYAKYVDGQVLWDLLQDLLARGYEGIVITKKSALYEPGKRPSKTTLKIKKELKETIDAFFTGRATAPTKEYTGKELASWPYWVDAYTDERLPESEHYFEVFHDHKQYIPVTKPYYKGFAGSLEIGLVEKSDGRCRLTKDSEWVDGLNIVSIGYLSGLTDEIKANYKDYAGRVIEVGAMQFDPSTNRLRHGKMLGWRDDKVWTECGIEQLKDK